MAEAVVHLGFGHCGGGVMDEGSAPFTEQLQPLGNMNIIVEGLRPLQHRTNLCPEWASASIAHLRPGSYPTWKDGTFSESGRFTRYSGSVVAYKGNVAAGQAPSEPGDAHGKFAVSSQSAA